MKALRIAFLLGTSGKTWGGMEQHTLDLARSLAARGHNVHLLAHPQYRARAN
ncbi:MAG: glycosyltransferase, partial [Marinobacter sp.]|nr:glycosyltransferase [Marinobacter sp.]